MEGWNSVQPKAWGSGRVSLFMPQGSSLLVPFLSQRCVSCGDHRHSFMWHVHVPGTSAPWCLTIAYDTVDPWRSDEVVIYVFAARTLTSSGYSSQLSSSRESDGHMLVWVPPYAPADHGASSSSALFCNRTSLFSVSKNSVPTKRKK